MNKQVQQPITWQQLKDFCNNLDEQFLGSPVMWWGDERGGSVKSTDSIHERYYLTDEGYAPLSTFEIDQPLADQVEDVEDYLEAGHPIIWVD